MADFLSQDDIDGLLDIASTNGEQMQKVFGEIASPKTSRKRNFAVYDFKRPNRISREQERTLHNLHEKISRALSSGISALLRSMVEVSLVGVDQMTYGEFIMSISNPTSFNIIGIKPMEGRCVIEINPNVATIIIEKLLGGSGPVEERGLGREFTEIELNIIQYVLKILLKELKSAWEPIHLINFAMETMESNYTNVQIASQNEIVVLATYEVKFRSEKGYISVCYPVIFLEPILNKLLSKSLLPDATNKRKKTHEIKALLSGSKVDFDVVLFEEKISFKSLLDMKAGSLITSSMNVDAPLVARINGKKKFDVTLGSRNGQKSIKVLDMSYDEQRETIQILKEIEETRSAKLRELITELDGFDDMFGSGVLPKDNG